MDSQTPPTFVDLFSGAGGLSLGLESAGLECVLAVDHWADAIATYQRNFAHHRAEAMPIQDLKGRRLAELIDGRPDWIVGGPPCQGYSTVGKRHRDDPRNELFLEFRRVVAKVRPAGFMIENVLGLKDMSFEEEVAASFERLGYTVEFMVLCSADYGVPQLRRRVLFVGRRDGAKFVGPPIVRDPDAYASVWEAIGDLPELGPGESAANYTTEPFTPYQKTMRDDCEVLQGHEASSHPADLVRAISFIPDGGNRRSIPDRYQPKSGFHNSYSRLSSTAPAVAVTQNMGKPSATRCIHPFQDRGLTAREGARLQSFPDRFVFERGRTSQRLQIANAVPPLLAEAIGTALLDPMQWK